MKTHPARTSKATKPAHPPVHATQPATASAAATLEKAEHKVEATVETLLPVGSWRRVAAGVAAAAGAGLFAVAWVGAGPAAIAGAAGYLAYRKLHDEPSSDVTKH